MNKKIIITNHTDKFVEWYDVLLENHFNPKDILIYDRVNTTLPINKLSLEQLSKFGTVISTPNVGYSIYVIGKYITENYENLPEYSIFLKCNLLQNNYTTLSKLKRALKSNYFVSLELEEPQSKYITPFTVNDHTYVEYVRVDEIKTDTKVYPRIKTFADFMNDLFVMEKIPEYVLFAPGGNYVVPRNNILKYSKNFYKKMMFYTNYHFKEVPEAHWFERVLLMAWTGFLEENFSTIVD